MDLLGGNTSTSAQQPLDSILGGTAPQQQPAATSVDALLGSQTSATAKNYDALAELDFSAQEGAAAAQSSIMPAPTGGFDDLFGAPAQQQPSAGASNAQSLLDL